MHALSVRTARPPNNLWKALPCYLAMLALSYTALAQNNSTVTIPRYDDKYSQLVRQLEAGQTNINYREFRDSFLESEQFKVVGNEKPDLDTLRKTMHKLMKESKYAEIVDIAKKMLSIDYTDMEAHKILQQTYKILGDASNQKKYHDIEFGLLNSIVKNGDRKTCRTAWPVIQVTEEYFILDMLGAKVLQQSIDTNGGQCDRMEVQTDEGKRVYYFEISKVFRGYSKRGIH
jgi:Response regulator containing CheY-like receiver and SARP domains